MWALAQNGFMFQTAKIPLVDTNIVQGVDQEVLTLKAHILMTFIREQAYR